MFCFYPFNSRYSSMMLFPNSCILSHYFIIYKMSYPRFWVFTRKNAVVLNQAIRAATQWPVHSLKKSNFKKVKSEMRRSAFRKNICIFRKLKRKYEMFTLLLEHPVWVWNFLDLFVFVFIRFLMARYLFSWTLLSVLSILVFIPYSF